VKRKSRKPPSSSSANSPVRESRRTEKSGGGESLSTVRAVDRAIAVLQCFTAETPVMSVLEIQRLVGLSRPTLYRLLQTLAGTGLITAEGDPQRFRLGHGVMYLAHAWLSGIKLIDVAKPIVAGLREKTGETAALFVMQDDHRICVLELESHHVLHIARGIGDRGGLTVGATGKAILAFLDEDRQAAAVSKALSKARQTEFVSALKAIRAQGYATSRSEVILGAVAVASPFFNHNGEVAGSIGVFGPTARVNDTDVPKIAKLVVEAASALSTQLGYRAKRLGIAAAEVESTRKVRQKP
jgi:DNA-binding IclR family transcriptional regulator